MKISGGLLIVELKEQESIGKGGNLEKNYNNNISFYI
jgi:hypothetical protein